MAFSTLPVLFSPNGFTPNSDLGLLRLSSRAYANSQINWHFWSRADSVSSVCQYTRSEFSSWSQLPSLTMEQRSPTFSVDLLRPFPLNLSSVIPSSHRPMCSWRLPRVKDNETEAYFDDDNLEEEEKALQRALEIAVREEDYALAAQLRDTIRAFRQNSEAFVLEANARFYNAYCKGDFKAMQALWGTWDDARCIHAGLPYFITGYEAIEKSWESLCRKTKGWKVTYHLSDIVVRISGNTGYVSCSVSFTVLEGMLIEPQLVTNVFMRVGDRWYLFSHHASKVFLFN